MGSVNSDGRSTFVYMSVDANLQFNFAVQFLIQLSSLLGNIECG